MKNSFLIFTITLTAACAAEFNPDLGTDEGPETGGATSDVGTAETGSESSTSDDITDEAEGTDDTEETGGPGPADLCEGGWDTYIVIHDLCWDPTNCASKYTAYNPDGSGATDIGFEGPTLNVIDVNPVDGRLAIIKIVEDQEYSSDVYVWDWFNDIETPVATEPDVTEWLPRWSHQGTQLSFERSQPISDGGERRCYRVMDDGTGYQKIYYDDSYGDMHPASGCTWSPNGQAVIWRTGNNGSVWHSDFQFQQMQQILNPDSFSAHVPRWSINGDVILVGRPLLNGTTMNVWRMDSDGGNIEQITQHEEEVKYALDWSPDGSQIIYVHRLVPNVGEDYEVIVMDADGSSPNVILNELGISYGIAGWGACP